MTHISSTTLVPQLDIDSSYVSIVVEMPSVDIGVVGLRGLPGTGVPAGGTTGQAMTKTSNTDYDVGWSTISKSTLGLGNVNNTADVDKPVSDPQQVELDKKINGANGATHLWIGNQAMYDAIVTKSGSTVYVII